MSVIELLYPFQREDVEYLAPQASVLIANEMGTGKTYEAIALDSIRRDETAHSHPKTLVVAPLAVLDSWERHFKRLTSLRVRRIDRKARHRLLDPYTDGSKPDVYLVHWEALRLMPDLRDVIWNHVIADECHKMKDRKAKQTRSIKQLRSKYKTAMSGTPLVNRPDELWSVLNWLYPQVFSSFWKFYHRFVDYEVIYPQGFHKIVGAKDVERLRYMIEPFFVRRRKADVMRDIPDKYTTPIWVELDSKQRRAYEAMRKEKIAWVGEHEDQPVVSPIVISQLIRLQQFALAYASIDDEGNLELEEPSAKLDALMDVLEDTDRGVVIYTQFTKMVKLVKKRLEKKKVSYVEYTGDVPQAKRDANVAKFIEGNTQVFIATIAAGGVGLDGLQHASSTVVFLDRAWSPALNFQAEDRLHRHGQTEPVQVIDIIARNTVDLGRHQRLVEKWGWIRKILGDDVVELQEIEVDGTKVKAA